MLRCILPWLCVLAILRAPVASRGDDEPADALAKVAALQQALQSVIERVSPSVVGIRARRHYVTVLATADGRADAASLAQTVVVNASGVVIAADGLILTNQHVVQSASDITILFHDGRVSSATVVAADARADLAVLRVARGGLTPVKYCDWSAVARGQWSIALGNPYGLGDDGQLSASVGVISNLRRRLPGLGEVDDRLYHDMIQTTATINPGNSGGPLFNIRGELIGIVTAMHTRSAVDDGVGFAIPMSPSRRRQIDLLARGRPIEYGYLGLTVRTAELRERRAAGPDGASGVWVQEVDADGPAASADVRRGDLVVRFDGRPVRDPSDLAELVGRTPVGAQVVVELYRGQRRLNVTVTIQRRQVSRISWMRSEASFWRGMRLANLTRAARQRMDVAADVGGIVVLDVAPDSAAARARMRVGDIIERVGGAPVADVAGFRQHVARQAGAVTIVVRQRGAVRVTP